MVKLILAIVLSTMLSIGHIAHAQDTQAFDAAIQASDCHVVSNNVHYIPLLLGMMGGAAAGFVAGAYIFGPIGALVGPFIVGALVGYGTYTDSQQYECRIQITHDKKILLFTIISNKNIEINSSQHFIINSTGQVQPF